MGKVSIQWHAPTKRRRTTPLTVPSLTLAQWKTLPSETTVLPLQPDMHFTFEGREHQLWISINKHGEPLLRFRHNDQFRMLIVSHTDETSVMLTDANGNDAGHFTVKQTGEVECTICKTNRHIEPLLEMMTDDAIADTLTGGVGKFVRSAHQQQLDLQPQAFTAFHRQIQRTQEQQPPKKEADPKG